MFRQLGKRRPNRMAYDKILELRSGSCSPPPKTTDAPPLEVGAEQQQKQINDIAPLSKWLNSHNARLPKFSKVTQG
jgi:hypothetical protein